MGDVRWYVWATAAVSLLTWLVVVNQWLHRRSRNRALELLRAESPQRGLELRRAGPFWGGVSYMALYELELEGLVESARYNEQGARFYALTDKGRAP